MAIRGLEKALRQLKSGELFFSSGGVFAPMLKGFIEAALQARGGCSSGTDERKGGNKRNGKGSKTIKSSAGSFEIETPQDRQSSFDPQRIKKRETVLADSLQDKIIGLSGLGMSLRDISAHIKELYNTELSHTVLSQITDRIIPEVNQNWITKIKCLLYSTYSVNSNAKYYMTK